MNNNLFPTYLGKAKCPFCNLEHEIYEGMEDIFCACDAMGEIRCRNYSKKVNWRKYISTEIHKY